MNDTQLTEKYIKDIATLRDKIANFAADVETAKESIHVLSKKVSDQKQQVLDLLQNGEPEESILISRQVKTSKKELEDAQKALPVLMTAKQSLIDSAHKILSDVRDEIPETSSAIEEAKEALQKIENSKARLVVMTGEVHRITAIDSPPPKNASFETLN